MTAQPDPTAARVALWRALHVEVDALPHVLEDTVGLELLAPPEDWRARGDMHPAGIAPFRASIVARARFIEDLVEERAAAGVDQYVLLGAGIDTFVQRRPELTSRMRVFEIDRPSPQEWKRARLVELGFGVPECLRFVPVDFEAGRSWRDALVAAGFDTKKPAVVASTGVSMYLSRETNMAMLRDVASFAPGSIFAMTFLLPLELADLETRPGLAMAAKGAAASGTPFVSYFTPDEIITMARDAGFREAHHVSADALAERYFSGRSDRLRPPRNAEELLVARTSR